MAVNPLLRRPTYPTVAMAIVIAGTLLMTVNMTMVNVALPSMGRDLQAAAGLDWIVTGYLLAVGISQPVTGWLSNRFGTTRTLAVALVLFACSSLLIAIGGSLSSVVLFRMLQGFGGGVLLPVGLTVVHQLYPPNRRGAALGIWGMAVMVGPAVGPVVGGWIIDAIGWRVLFMANLPAGLLVAAAASRWLRDAGARLRQKLDWPGVVLIGAALTALLVASSWAGHSSPLAPPVLAMALLAVVAGALFVLRQVRAPAPLLDMTMFGDRVFSVTIAIVWLATMGHYVVMVLVPVLAQAVYGARALETGLLIAPSALVTALFMPLSGRLADRIGPRIPVAAGIALMGLAVWLLMTLPIDPPLARIAAIMALHGLGVGLSVTPNTVTAMNAVPAALVGQASAMRAVNRQASAALSVAIVAGVITYQAGGLAPAGIEPSALLDAYQLAFAILLVPVLAGAAVALALPGRRANEAIQRHRMEEHMALATD